jgi:hypothetical protein
LKSFYSSNQTTGSNSSSGGRSGPSTYESMNAESSDVEQQEQAVEYVVAEMAQTGQQPIEAQDVELITIFKPDIHLVSDPAIYRCISS